MTKVGLVFCLLMIPLLVRAQLKTSDPSLLESLESSLANPTKSDIASFSDLVESYKRETTKYQNNRPGAYQPRTDEQLRDLQLQGLQNLLRLIENPEFLKKQSSNEDTFVLFNKAIDTLKDHNEPQAFKDILVKAGTTEKKIFEVRKKILARDLPEMTSKLRAATKLLKENQGPDALRAYLDKEVLNPGGSKTVLFEYAKRTAEALTILSPPDIEASVKNRLNAEFSNENLDTFQREYECRVYRRDKAYRVNPKGLCQAGKTIKDLEKFTRSADISAGANQEAARVNAVK